MTRARLRGRRWGRSIAKHRSLTGTLGAHVAAVLLHTILLANAMWLLPLLVQKQFGPQDDKTVRDWMTYGVTAAVPTFMAAAIFWNEALRRMRLRSYLLISVTVTAAPYALLSLAQSYWHLLALHIVGAIGHAAWPPAQGRLLRLLYPDAIRGRVFSIIRMAEILVVIAAAWLVGRWVNADDQAFRLFFPLAATLQIVTLILLMRLAAASGDEPPAPVGGARSWSDALAPVLHIGRILRNDAVFFRYELAFMTYGAAFMVCDALTPIYATEVLGVDYEEYANTTQVAMRTAMLAATLPMGVFMDRVGPMRLCGVMFLLLTSFPLLLLFAPTVFGFTSAWMIWGVAMAGVAMGWMLGPVALAPRPELAAHYTSIHTALVGVRGVLFQSAGMLIYSLSGSFAAPLLLAAVLFVAGAVQMWMLAGAARRRAAASALTTPPQAMTRPSNA